MFTRINTALDLENRLHNLKSRLGFEKKILVVDSYIPHILTAVEAFGSLEKKQRWYQKDLVFEYHADIRTLPDLTNYDMVLTSFLLSDPSAKAPDGLLYQDADIDVFSPIHAKGKLFAGGLQVVTQAIEADVPVMLIARNFPNDAQNIYTAYEGGIAAIAKEHLTSSSDYEFGGFNAQKKFALYTNETIPPVDKLRTSVDKLIAAYELFTICLENSKSLLNHKTNSVSYSFMSTLNSETMAGHHAREDELHLGKTEEKIGRVSFNVDKADSITYKHAAPIINYLKDKYWAYRKSLREQSSTEKNSSLN